MKEAYEIALFVFAMAVGVAGMVFALYQERYRKLVAGSVRLIERRNEYRHLLLQHEASSSEARRAEADMAHAIRGIEKLLIQMGEIPPYERKDLAP